MPPGSPKVMDLPPGTQIGRYALLHRIAVGGMAELYVARQSGLEGFERTVVLKRILPHLTDDPEFVRMFLDEARIAAGLDHPNVAQVTDIDLEDGEYFFAMEYVHGVNLRQLVKAGGELTMGIALRVVTQVAAGLHHAHESLGADGLPLGLVHRDVSPANIMIAYSGAVKLTDFGIAKASARTSRTLEGRIKGKVGYMSPEQCRGDDDLDRRSDIFALGILLYETTTGIRAFYSANDFATMAKITRAEYRRAHEHDPSYPAELERIIDRALQKDPAKRYATVEEMRIELEDYAHANAVKLTETELAARMVSLFGTPAHPQTLRTVIAAASSEPVDPTGFATVVAPPATDRRRSFAAAGVVAALAAAAGIALVTAGGAGDAQKGPPLEANPTSSVGQQAETPAALAPTDAPRAPEAAPVELEKPPVSPVADDGSAATPTTARADVGGSDAPDPTKSKPSKRVRRPKKARKDPKPASGRSPYPPGYKP